MEANILSMAVAALTISTASGPKVDNPGPPKLPDSVQEIVTRTYNPATQLVLNNHLLRNVSYRADESMAKYPATSFIGISETNG